MFDESYDSSLTDLIYVPRLADKALLYYLNHLDKPYCYIQSPSKTGKTLLLSETRNKLEEAQVRCAVVSLLGEEIANQQSEQDWYGALTRKLAREFQIYDSQRYEHFVQLDERFTRHPRIALNKFIHDVLLQEVSEEVVIFIDDLDKLLDPSLFNQDENTLKDFRNQFFRTLRRCYERRATSGDVASRAVQYNRLTFVLAGTAPVLELDIEPTCTLFDGICKCLKLRDFTPKQLHRSQAFLDWIHNVDISSPYLEEVLENTKGHPTLTALLLKQVLAHPIVSRVINQRLVANWKTPGSPLSFLLAAQQKLERPENEDMRDLCNRILDGASIQFDSSNEIHIHLSSLGILTERSNLLVVHNPIFRIVLQEISQSWSNPQSTPDSLSPSFPLPNSSLPMPSPTNIPSNEGGDSSLSFPDFPTRLTPSQPITDEEASPPHPPFSRTITKASLIIFCLEVLVGFILLVIDVGVSGSWILPVFMLHVLAELLRFSEGDFTNLKDVLRSFGLEIKNTFTHIIVDICSFWGRQRRVFRRWGYRLLLVIAVIILIAIFQDYIKAAKSGWREGEITQEAKEAIEIFNNPEPGQIEALQKAIKVVIDSQKLKDFQSYLPWIKNAQYPTSSWLALQYIYDNIYERGQYRYSKLKEFSHLATNGDGEVVVASAKTKGLTNNGNHSDSWIAILKYPNKIFTGLPEPFYTGHDSGITDLSLDQKGTYLATAGGEGKIKIWKLDTLGTTENQDPYQELNWNSNTQLNWNSDTQVTNISFSTDETYIAAIGSDGYLKAWGLDKKFKIISNKPFINEMLSSKQADLSIYKNCVITVGDSKPSQRIQAWRVDNTSSNRKIKFIDNQDLSRNIDYIPTSVDVSSQGYIAVAGEYKAGQDKGKKAIQVWKFNSDKCEVDISLKSKLDVELPNSKVGQSFSEVRFNKAGDRLFMMLEGGAFNVLKISETSSTIETDLEAKLQPYNNSSIGVLAIAGNGQFYTAVGDDLVRLWDLDLESTKRRLEKKVYPHLKKIRVRLNHDGQASETIALLTVEGSLKILGDGLTQKKTNPFTSQADEEITSLDTTREGDALLVVGTRQGLIHFRNWNGDKPQQGYKDFSVEIPVVDLAFDPLSDNRFVAVAGSKSVVLYETMTGEAVGQPIPETKLSNVQSIKFSPNGRYLAVLANSSLQIWNVSDSFEKPEQILIPSDKNFSDSRLVRDVQFYPAYSNQSGAIFATLSEDSKVTFWQISQDQNLESKQELSPEPNLQKPKIQPRGSLDIGNVMQSEASLFEKTPSGNNLSFSTVTRSNIAVGSEEAILVWDISEQDLQSGENLSDRLVAVFRGHEKWRQITSLEFLRSNYVLASSENGWLIKVPINKMSNRKEMKYPLIYWGCTWLEDYHNSSKTNEPSKKICSKVLHPEFLTRQ